MAGIRCRDRAPSPPAHRRELVAVAAADRHAHSAAQYQRRAAVAAIDPLVLHDFGPDKETGEPVFAPRSITGDETDGWVMTFVYDRKTDRSDFVLLDARDIAAAPVATIHLPRRVPHGLHGNWMAA